MGQTVLQQSWLQWSIILMGVFPLLMVILNESILRLSRQKRAMVQPLRIIQNLVLPLLVVFLFANQVLGYDREQPVLQVMLTLLLLAILHLSLSCVNVMLFMGAGANTWQTKVPKLLRDLARVFLILVGASIVLSTVWKLDLGGLLTALGVSSIVLGLALQDTLGNLFSGVALLFGRPFQIGDWLEVEGTIGKVTEVNWRAVHLMTREQEMLIVPNSVLAKEIFTNYNQPVRRHVEPIDISFSYDDPPNQVKQVLKEAALATKGVLAKPKPEIQTLNYGDSAIDYRVRLFLADYSRVPQIRDEFLTRIWYAAKRYGLNIPFPIRTVFYQPILPENKATNEANLLAELQSLPALASVEPDSLAEMISEITVQQFGQGDPIIHQDQTDVQLHLVLKGAVKITVRAQNQREQEISRLTRGEFFGTLALLNHEPSPNAVIALQDCEVAVFETEALHIILARTPRLSQELGEMIEGRRKAIRLTQ